MTNWAPPTRIAIGAICLVASFVMSIVTWVALGDIAGYGVMRFVMPAVVDTYISCALITWLTVPDREVGQLARRNTYGAAAFGTLTQAIYHGAVMWTGDLQHPGHIAWRACLAFICGGIPPAGAFLSAHMIIKATRVSGAHSTSAPTETVRQNQPEPPTRTPPTPTAIAPTVSAPSTVVPAPSPVTATPAPSTQPPRAPTPPTAGRGTTAARGHSNTEWARGVTRPTRPRPGSVLTEEEWATMDGLTDAGISDFDVGKRMGRSEATVKKRRLERQQRRAQRNGDERMVRQ